tara:strand:- start:248 stop:571 length:324 start_codon:yes stop_codon:yes gene_type:complete
MTILSPKAVAMMQAGIIKWKGKGGMYTERAVSDEEYNAWNEAWKDKQFETFSFSEWKSKLPKRIQDRFPAQIQYVDANKTQTIPQMNYWIFTVPLLVLAVVFLRGRA